MFELCSVVSFGNLNTLLTIKDQAQYFIKQRIATLFSVNYMKQLQNINHNEGTTKIAFKFFCLAIATQTSQVQFITSSTYS